MADEKYVSSHTGPEIDEGVRLALEHLPPEPTASGTNRNLLDNPWFTVNQRGATTYTVGQYGVDRWKLISGSATVNADHTITLSGTLRQILEDYILDDVTASVQTISGEATASFDVATKSFDIVSAGGRIQAAKLELGEASTLSLDSAPDYTIELLKCQRYYQVFNNACVVGMSAGGGRLCHFPLSPKVNMRGNPAISGHVPTIFGGGNNYTLDDNEYTLALYKGSLSEPSYILTISSTKRLTSLYAQMLYFSNLILSADL